MRLETRMDFVNYSEEAMGQVIEQAPGKPFFERSGDTQRKIGEIVSARRVDNTTVVVFEIDTFTPMKRFSNKLQMIIGKKTRELKEMEKKDPGAIECPILECEIDDAISMVGIINADAPKEDKLSGIKTIYLQTTSGSIFNAVQKYFKEEGLEL